jgi:AraC-like DNA-binding protein
MRSNNKISETKEMYIRLINKTEDYIEQNLKKPISLADLAKNANLSDYHFHRIFKKHSSETVNKFITRFKLERIAIFLFVNSTISITDIAMDYGYNDASAFSKTFKRHFGLSPINYRKQQELTCNSTDPMG